MDVPDKNGRKMLRGIALEDPMQLRHVSSRMLPEAAADRKLEAAKTCNMPVGSGHYSGYLMIL